MPALAVLTVLCLALKISAEVFGSTASCNGFSFSDIPGVTLVGKAHFSANATVNIANLFSSINTSSLPAFCRVQILVTTNATAGSFANTEVWLPDLWNNRTLTVGNGAYAGGGA